MGEEMKNRSERDMDLARKIARDVCAAGGRAYFVGGVVRDGLVGLETKDIDLEIYGVSPEELREILRGIGEVYEKGAAFGVLSLRGTNLDIAMPRTESVIGPGHRDFDVAVDPALSPQRASRRRDFTINAMMRDVLTGEILDFWGGRKDLEGRIVRHVADDTFPEDPLRVFRAAQFAARFRARIAPETIELCRDMEVRSLSKERVFEELSKALLKADRPSIFFESLREMEQMHEFFPEIEKMIGVPQNPQYHPEGDVFRHTMLVVDQAASLRDQAKWPLAFMLSALCHDLGKIDSTEISPDGRITSYLHPITGQALAEAQMERWTSHRKLLRYVENMVEMHMRPNQLAMCRSKKKKTRQMFDASECPEDLILLSRADASGKRDAPYDIRLEEFLRERLEDYRQVLREKMVTGEDLQRAGFSPDERFGQMLRRARELHFSGYPADQALKQIVREFPK